MDLKLHMSRETGRRRDRSATRDMSRLKKCMHLSLNKESAVSLPAWPFTAGSASLDSLFSSAVGSEGGAVREGKVANVRNNFSGRAQRSEKLLALHAPFCDVVCLLH